MLGFLFVSSEPGNHVSLDEFQDWYNTEHVPLRLNHLPCFLSGARYQERDGNKPSWLAVYDIDDISTFSDPNYTRLRTNRSPREADLIKRLELLDRRTFSVLQDSGESQITTSLRYGNPTPLLVTHGLSTEAWEIWWKSNLKTIRSTDGWVRTRIFECLDHGRSGTGIEDGSVLQSAPPKFFVIHEFTPKPDGSTSIGDIDSVVELREWKLYRAYPCIAQGNLP